MCIHVCVCISLSLYIYIYIYVYTYVRGNNLSNTTCLTQAFFKRGEECSKLRWSLTRRNTHKTNEAVVDKQL